MRPLIATLALALVVAACGMPADLAGGDGSVPSDSPPTGGDLPKDEDPSDEQPPPDLPDRVDESDEPVTGEVPDGILDEVLAMATDLTGVPLADLVVVRSESVTWSNGALGCPEPGMNYTEAIEPGYWVEIVAGDKELDYRIAERGFVKLCESPTFDSPTP